ncbi:MAG: putative membrane protein [Cyclobacteriaceae bacterium]|jgi:putative membrane protein
MYTKKKYSGMAMLRWTRRELRFFVLIAIILTVFYDTLGFHFLQIPWTAMALIGTAVAFLIGFQSNAVYGRLWEARMIWGAIVNDSRMLTLMIKEMINNEHADDPASDHELVETKRRLVHRHIAWMTALRHAMRAVKPWEAYRLNKRNQEMLDALHIPELEISLEDDLKKHLSEDEHRVVLTKTNKAAGVMTAQAEELRQLKERGLIWEFSYLEMNAKISELIGHQGKSERIKNFPYPRQFATLGYTFVNLFILLLPFGIVPEFHRLGGVLTEEFPIIGQYFVWLGVPFSALVSWVFNTMQRIGTVGENPFEGSANDVPISTIARGIEIDILEMIDTPKDQIPGPIPSDFDVQM